MDELNNQIYKIGLPGIIKKYMTNYYDLHGNILPAEGLYQCVMKEIEKPLIEVTLSRLNGNQVKVAKLLGINRNTLRRKIKELNISIEKPPNEA